jgi:hypothetical protein
MQPARQPTSVWGKQHNIGRPLNKSPVLSYNPAGVRGDLSDEDDVLKDSEYHEYICKISRKHLACAWFESESLDDFLCNWFESESESESAFGFGS